MKLSEKLDPNWVVGFTDGEGCFHVSFNQREKLKTKLEARPSFSISQSGKRNPPKEALDLIQQFFECGQIRFNKADGTYKYETVSLKDLWEKIVPFFDAYPLKTTKLQDFEKFRQVLILMRSCEHLNATGLSRVISLSYSMNPSGKRKYTQQDLLRFMKS